LLNIFAYATKLAPTNPPLAFAVTPLGGFWIMCFANLQWAPGVGVVFDVGRPFVVTADEGGKITALQVAKNCQKNGICGLQMNCLITQNTVIQLDAE
jgi:hypothetical protein